MPACPRDQVNLVAGKVRGFSVSHCRTCAGLWLTPALVATAVGHLPRLVSKNEATRAQPILCPGDGTVLVPVHHRGVEIDVCTACGGVWLDHGELDRILRTRPSRYNSWDAATKEHPSRLLIEGGGKIITNPDLLSAAGESAADAAGAILTFIAEALSGF